MKEVALKAVMVFMPMMLRKPARNSKAKDHCRYLEKRLHLWEQGKLDSILSECNEIQTRMIKAQTKEMSNLTRKFTNLMLLGKLSQASKLINRANGGILCMNEEVEDQLLQKHPAANPLNLDAILSGPIQKPEKVIFESIDAEMVGKAIKRINGSGGPTLIDADCWKQVACSDSFNFKTIQRNLCDAIARLARYLSTSSTNSQHLNELLACRLIPLNKKPGVRPIGIGEILHRIIGKCVMLT